MKKDKIIHYNDDSAARYVENIKGWLDKDNHFYGDDDNSEHYARWSSCTHQTCKCGELMSKNWTKCNSCRNKADIERYNALPFREYFGEPVYSHSHDKYFWDEDDLINYCEEDGIESEDLRLVFCDPVKYSYLDGSRWEDDLPEEGELPKALEIAIDNLNNVIDTLPVASYYPSKTRTVYNK